MFDLPDAKRVRREELFGSDDDEIVGGAEEEEELRAKLNARLSGLLSSSLSIPTSATTPTEGGAAAEGEGDENNKDGPLQFEFKLFSTSAPSTKVILPSGEDELLPDADEGGALVRERPLSYYIRPELTADEKERFAFAAVSGDDVTRWSGQRAWGLEVPWRVVKIQVPRATYHELERALRQLYPSRGEKEDRDGMEGVIEGQTETEGKEGTKGKKKVRPGKKRRIALRVRLAETKKKQEEMKKKLEAQEKERMTKEEHLREKKKRLNREKKLKRRQKEKEKKMGIKGEGGGEGSQQGGSVAGGSNRDEDGSMSDREGDERTGQGQEDTTGKDFPLVSAHRGA